MPEAYDNITPFACRSDSTQRDVVDVSKDLVAAEVRRQAVMQPTGRKVGLFPSVA
jgi:hypothetical protein